MDEKILKQAFSQARLKVDRAYAHLTEAQQWFDRYIKSDFCTIIEERDPEKRTQSFFLQSEGIPAPLVLAIGDAFHCLSASLDYVATGMMRAAGASSVRIGFPADITRKALRDSFKKPRPGGKIPPKRSVVETFPAFTMLLLQRLKPYRGGDFLLWEVRKADNIDKHNLIIPMIAIASRTNISFMDDNGTVTMRNADVSVSAGSRFEIVTMQGFKKDLKVEHDGYPSASIRFPKSMEVFAGEPVFPTMIQCIKLVSAAIDLVEREGAKPFRRAPSR